MTKVIDESDGEATIGRGGINEEVPEKAVLWVLSAGFFGILWRVPGLVQHQYFSSTMLKMMQLFS